jgi:hypothetical protein
MLQCIHSPEDFRRTHAGILADAGFGKVTVS